MRSSVCCPELLTAERPPICALEPVVELVPP